MGITYKAFDTNLRTNVALKVINATYLDSEIARQRFLREARAAAAIRHPNVATVFHLGKEDESFFYAMEFIDGETVEGFMQREGAVPTLMALEIAAQVARALGAAEKQGLVHRDIKPSNLMLIRDGGDDEFLVKVIDFGLAKAAERDSGDTATLTQGGFLGTPHFASPEQLEERELDSRSDIYSLGVTLYYMLAGRTPFSGSLAQVMSQHLHREPPLELLAGQPRAVIALLERMMAKDPDNRPQTPTDLRREIEACVDLVAEAGSGTAGGQAADALDAATVADSRPDAAPEELRAGGRLAGHLELIEEYEAGECGKTFRARDTETDKIVAVLVLDPHLLPTSQAYTRLENEVVALQAVRHPAVIRVHSLERADQISFVTREWVEGPSLLDAMRKDGALAPDDAIEILTSLAGGLEAVQKTGVPCPVLSAHWITLVKVGETTLPKFNALNFAAVAPAGPDVTLVGRPAGRGTGADTHYGVELAALAYRMLGGMSDPASSFIPIPGISEEANLVLRRALRAGRDFESPVAFVAALEDALGTVTPVAAVRSGAHATVVAPPRRAGFPTSLLVTIGLVIAAGVLVAAILVFREKPVPTADATPTPTATPLVVATPTPTPTPDPLGDDIKRAEDMAAVENYADALGLLRGLREKYPQDTTRLKTATENIIAKLGSETDDFLTGERLEHLADLLDDASQQGSTAAQMILGKSHLPSDPKRAFNYFYLAAENGGNSEARYQLGELYASGKGMEQRDYTRAVEQFQKAGFHPQAIYSLGECYYLGNGVAKDNKRAWELLNVAANQYDNQYAQLLLGDMYQNGELGKPNYGEAARLYSAAAKKGLQDATAKLILMEFMGRIVDGKAVAGEPKLDHNTQVAMVERFRQEAERRNRLAMYYYALCLLGEELGIQDTVAGREWMTKSATMGCEVAQKFCKKNGWSYTEPPR
jgi:serine/threonine protein kinase/TPR repeat protein